MKHRLTRFARHVLFWGLFSLASVLVGGHFVLASIAHYKAALENQLSETLSVPVKIGRLRAKWRGVTPQIQLLQIDVADEKIQLKEIRLGVNVWELIKQQNLLASTTVTLLGANITFIRHVDGTIGIEGLKASEGEPLWLLQGRKYQILQSTMHWRDEKTQATPRQLSPVNIAIMNEGDVHRVNMLAQLPKQLEPLRVSMTFTGNTLDPQKIEGRVFVSSKKINLADMSMLPLPLSLNVLSGHASLDVFATWKQGQISAIHGQVNATQIRLNRPQHPDLHIKDVQSHFQLHQENDIWQVMLPALHLSLPDTHLDGALAVTLNEHAPIQNSLALNVEKIDLAALMPVLHFVALDKSAAYFNQVKLGGALQNIRVFAQPGAQKIALSSEFEDVGFYDVTSKLHIEHLNGFLHGDELAGELALHSDKLAVSIPALFSESFSAISLATSLKWQQTPQAWRFLSEHVTLNNKDIHSDSRVKWILSKESENFIDLQTAFSLDDASQTPHYLPAGVIGKETLAWLNRAFEKGRLNNGQFLLYGNPAKFPFEKNQGVFEVLFDANDAQLFYAPNWPVLTNIDATVRFFQDSLQVNLQANAQNAHIKAAEVTIASMLKSHYVSIDGDVEGEISDVLHFMQDTPLHTPFDAVLNAVTPQGRTQMDLGLHIPLDDNYTAKVKGAAQFHQAKLKVKALDLPLSALHGTLQFTEQGVFSEPIAGVALKKPIQIALSNNDKQTHIHVNGNAAVNDIFTQLKLPLPVTSAQQKAWIEGAGEYQLTLSLPKEHGAATLQIDSMLEGVTLNLPSELFKPAWQKAPLNLLFTLDDESWVPLMLDYNSQLKMALMIDTKNKRFQRGEIRFGEGNATLPDSEGLSVSIVQSPLILQDWLTLALTQVPSSMEKNDNVANTVRTVALHSNHARWKSASLGQFDLALKHEAHTWRGQIESAFAKGQIQWTLPEKTTQNASLKLMLEKFDLAFFKPLQSADETHNVLPPAQPATSFANWPTLFLESQQTFWQSCELGKLTLETEPRASSIALKTLTLQAPTHNVKLTGDWFHAPVLQTEVRGKVTLLKAGELFSHLGLTNDISETVGELNINVDWPGSPQQFSLASLRGQAEVNLKKGRILSIEPGFGRILGMLAFEQWLKRLQLDFSDLYQEGLTFNTISGHFDFFQGKASTQNLIVDAIPAKIHLKGDTDFVAEKVNYFVNVTPKSADALPIAGTIVAKIMNLVGQTLTGRDQEGFFFGSQYQITGPWGNTQVIALHENEGLMQKTWGQLTQFPWLHQQLNSKEAYHE